MLLPFILHFRRAIWCGPSCELFSMIPLLPFSLSTNCPFKWKTTPALWSIIEWRHFYFISCLRQLFYGTQIDDLFRFVINQISRRDSICIYFFSWLIHFFELERHFEGQDYWLKFFSWRSVYLISSIRYQFDPDILYDVHLIDFYIFSSFRNKIGIFCVIVRRSLALKYYFGFEIFFWIWQVKMNWIVFTTIEQLIVIHNIRNLKGDLDEWNVKFHGWAHLGSSP